MSTTAWRIAAGVLFVVSGWMLLAPGDAVPAPALFPHADKLVHAGMFAVLGFVLARAVPTSRNAIIIGALIAYGALTEIGQMWVIGRSGDVWDFLADSAGAALGVLASRVSAHRV